jgi:site-specific DNA recombinase
MCSSVKLCIPKMTLHQSPNDALYSTPTPRTVYACPRTPGTKSVVLSHWVMRNESNLHRLSAQRQVYNPAYERCRLYTRVSTIEQSDSLPVQERKCRDFAQSQGLNIVHVFTDAGESARTADRPQLQAMRAFCRKRQGKLGHVIVADLSRLARNSGDQNALIVELANWGIRLRSVDEQHIDGTASGKFMAGMIGAFNQHFSDSLSERTQYRMQAAVRAGRFVWRAPVGYVNSRNGAGSTIKPDPMRAPLVRKGFELMASGSYHADDVLRSITALGLRTLKDRPLPRQTWYAILRNPLYAGWVKSGDLVARGVHQPIVSQELFDTVQDVLAGRSKTAQPRQVLHPEFPLRQFTRCAKCGKGLTGGMAKKKFPYYWCYQKDCLDVFVPKDELEHQFVSLLAMHQPTVELLERLPDIARKHWQTREERTRQDSRALTIRLQEQKRLNSTAIKAKLRGELSGEDFDALKVSIAEDTTLIEQQLSALESERSTMEELLAQTERELVDLVAAWNKAGVNQRRELCTGLFPDGLVWSHQWGFLNHQNVGLMQDLRAFMDNMASGVNVGVPDGI